MTEKQFSLRIIHFKNVSFTGLSSPPVSADMDMIVGETAPQLCFDGGKREEQGANVLLDRLFFIS